MNDAIRDALPADIAGESKFQWLTRIGFIARGLLYIMVGVLAIVTGRTEDMGGALEYVGDGVGRWLLIVIAAGLLTYAIWRLSDGAFGTEHGSGTWKARRKRMAAVGAGLVYLFLGYRAVVIILADRAAKGDDAQADAANTVIDLPGGIWMLGAVALGTAIAGVVQIRKANSCSFLKPLDAEAVGVHAKLLGRCGYAARGIVLLCIAYLLGMAAYQSRPGKVGGMEEALDLMSDPIRYAVAAGLILFGLFSLVEARYRIIHKPPEPDQVAGKVKDAVSGDEKSRTIDLNLP